MTLQACWFLDASVFIGKDVGTEGILLCLVQKPALELLAGFESLCKMYSGFVWIILFPWSVNHIIIIQTCVLAAIEYRSAVVCGSLVYFLSSILFFFFSGFSSVQVVCRVLINEEKDFSFFSLFALLPGCWASSCSYSFTFSRLAFRRSFFYFSFL